MKLGTRGRACAAAGALVLLLWLSLWVGTPTGWGPFEALGHAVFGEDPGARTLARARAIEVLALALAGAVQVAAAWRAAPASRRFAVLEAPAAWGASAFAWTAFCGYGAGWAGAGAVVAGLAAGFLAPRAGGGARGAALVALLPLCFAVHALATSPSASAVWLRLAGAWFGDVAGLDGARAAVLGAGGLALGAALALGGGAGRPAAAAAAALAAGATGWFTGLAWALGAGLGPLRTLGPLGAAGVGAGAAVLGEAALAAVTAPGRLPVAAASLGLAVLVALFLRSGDGPAGR